jgi:gluconate 2-dehydrogenase gamma chain
MVDSSRRDLFRIFGATAALAGGSGELLQVEAQHTHPGAEPQTSLDGGPNYKPKTFTQHNFETLKKIAEMIVPGASEAGAAEYIDFLCSRNDDLAAIFNGGLAWVDHYMTTTHGLGFLQASDAHRTELFDKLAWSRNVTPDTAPCVQFWTWTRNIVVDAFYTSPAGVQDIGYMGNKILSSFSVPKEAVDYAVQRSPFANGG